MRGGTKRTQEIVPLALQWDPVYLPNFTCLQQAKNLQEIGC